MAELENTECKRRQGQSLIIAGIAIISVSTFYYKHLYVSRHKTFIKSIVEKYGPSFLNQWMEMNITSTGQIIASRSGALTAVLSGVHLPTVCSPGLRRGKHPHSEWTCTLLSAPDTAVPPKTNKEKGTEPPSLIKDDWRNVGLSWILEHKGSGGGFLSSPTRNVH